jgi:hypothetical protein
VFRWFSYAILFYTRNSGFWLDNWRSACPERLFSMPKSRYLMKAEIVNFQTFLTKLSAWVFTSVKVVGYHHITIHIIFDIAFVICIQWLQQAWQILIESHRYIKLLNFIPFGVFSIICSAFIIIRSVLYITRDSFDIIRGAFNIIRGAWNIIRGADCPWDIIRGAFSIIRGAWDIVHGRYNVIRGTFTLYAVVI